MSDGAAKSSKTAPRLHVKAAFIGYLRGKNAAQKNHTQILRIEGVNEKADTQFYLGKRVAYIYRCKKSVKGSKFRVEWGHITRHHGNTGAVRAKFRNNLDSNALGNNTLRVMLYPSSL